MKWVLYSGEPKLLPYSTIVKRQDGKEVPDGLVDGGPPIDLMSIERQRSGFTLQVLDLDSELTRLILNLKFESF
jgi:hypothetical protein